MPVKQRILLAIQKYYYEQVNCSIYPIYPVFMSIFEYCIRKGMIRRPTYERKWTNSWNIFTFTWGVFFLLIWKRVVAQITRWKHIGWISCDTEKRLPGWLLVQFPAMYQPLMVHCLYRQLLTKSNPTTWWNFFCKLEMRDGNPTIDSVMWASF